MIEPTIFLGPPGTGKTTTLLDTVDREMEQGVPPDRIGFMTFTKRGVEEAISRAAERFSLPRSRFRFFNTLHSAAFRHLDLKTDEVFTGKRVQEFASAYGLEIHGGLSSDDGTYSSFYGDDLVLFFENLARITCRSVEEILRENDYILPDYDRAMRIIRDFRNYKKAKGYFDFTDMLEQFILLDEPPMLEVLMVDEAQDLSELQWKMVEQLTRFIKRMYVAGDDDQTIFTWAGASTRFITMPGKVDVLQQSYRVPIKSFNLANHVIKDVSTRRPKLWLPRKNAIGKLTYLEGISQLDNRSLNSEQSVMMLGRTVKLIKNKFIPYCRGHGLLYRYFEANSIKPTQAKAITAWNYLKAGKTIPATDALKIYNLLRSERYTKNPGVAHGFKTKLSRLTEQQDPPELDLQDLRRDYGLLVSGTWQEVFTEVDPRDRDYIQKVIDNGYNLLEQPKIHISTIHRVKGGQADRVVLLSDTAKLSDKFATNSDEETRVFYTGITRTFEELTIVQPDKSRYHERLFE